MGFPVILKKVWGKVWDCHWESDIVRRKIDSFFFLPLISAILAGCSPIGNKNASVAVIYAVAVVLSLSVLVCYCCVSKKRDAWHLLLFSCVLVVNIGYFSLAVSRSLDEALLANRLAYLGSVFLPLSMCMIILNVAKIRYRKWLPMLMLALGVVVFLIAASPGYLKIYYQEVSLEKVNGVTVLKKVYGPFHGINMVYLLGYFTAMIITVVQSIRHKRVESPVHSVILAIAVFINIGVWLIEQLVHIDFEILSVSYIISESFLLGLNLLMAENEMKKAQLLQQNEEIPETPERVPCVKETEAISTGGNLPGGERIELFLAGIPKLTPKEMQLYDCYVAGMSTVQIMEQLSIKENTLKFHNKNLYGKLGVSSRKQLLELHRRCAADTRKGSVEAESSGL